MIDAPGTARETDRGTAPEVPQAVDPRILWRWAAGALRPVAGWITVALGGLALLLGWVGVSREVLVAKQLPYLISGGFGGLALVFFGAKLLNIRDIQRYEERLERLESFVVDLHELLLIGRDGGDDPGDPRDQGDARDPRDQGDREAASPNGSGRVVVLEGGRSFHRPDCGRVRGKAAAESMSAADAAQLGKRPCRGCRPTPLAEWVV